MGSSDDLSKLAPLVAELDQGVSKNGAVVRLERYGGGSNESKIVANRLGYLRLGIEFLKAALAAPTTEEAAGPATIGVELSYLIHPDSNINFVQFERCEDLSIPPAYEQSFVARAASVGCLIFCLLVVALVVAGLMSLIF